MTTQDQLIAAMVASYVSPIVSDETEEPKKKAKGFFRKAKVKEVPNAAGLTLPLEPNIGFIKSPVKLDLDGYRKAVAEAGYRLDPTGKRFFDSATGRDDLIRAIDGYIGYDHSRDFASQELAARQKAIRAMQVAKGNDCHIPTKQEKRAVFASLEGFVAGIPTKEKQLANLRAREQKAVDTIIELEKAGENSPSSFMLADVERERLESIRNDIAQALAQV
jgi:hypothetical protein